MTQTSESNQMASPAKTPSDPNEPKTSGSGIVLQGNLRKLKVRH